MQKAHVPQKIVLYFKGVTINTENYSQQSCSLHLRDKQCKQFSTPQEEKPIRKKKRKEIARSSVGRSSDKSHNTNVFQIILLSFQRSYNHLGRLQNPSLLLRKLQSAKPFPTSVDRDRPTLVKEKTTRKRKIKRKRRRKERRRGIAEGTGLKAFQVTSLPPLQAFLSRVPSMGWTREQHNPHRGGTREKHNSYKQKSRETKRQPMTVELTSRSGDQTLKLYRL